MIGAMTEERAHKRPFLLAAYMALCAALLTAVVVLAYSAISANGYVWDDWEIAARSMGVQGQSAIETVLGPVLPGAPYFRPLVISTFVAEMRWGGPDPARAHVISLAIHVANALLLYAVLLVLATKSLGPLNFKSVTWLACGALLYALHPALVESVAWMSARFDLLATTFALLYLLIGLALRGPARLPLLTVIFLAAMLCKEVVIGLPIFLAILNDVIRPNADDRFLSVSRLKGLIEGVVICLLGAIIYFYAKSHYIDQAIFTDQFVANYWGGWKRLALVGETLLTYLSIIFVPFTSIGPHHPMPWAHSMGVRPIIICAALICFTLLAVVQVLRGRWWMLVGLMCVLAPIMNILPISVAGSIAQDRYLTLPLAALIISGSMVALKSPQWLRVSAQILPAALFLALLFVFLMNVRVTVPLWKSDLTLWAWAAEKHGSLPYVRKNHVSSLIAYGFLDKAEAVLAQEVEVSVATREVKLQEAMLRAQLQLKRVSGRWSLKLLRP